MISEHWLPIPVHVSSESWGHTADRAARIASRSRKEKKLRLTLPRTSAHPRSTTSRSLLFQRTDDGCFMARKCFGVLFFEESQHPTWPQLDTSAGEPKCRPS